MAYPGLLSRLAIKSPSGGERVGPPCPDWGIKRLATPSATVTGLYGSMATISHGFGHLTYRNTFNLW